MFKHAKTYEVNIPSSHRPNREEKISFDRVYSPYTFNELRAFLFRNYSLPKLEVEHALNICTKNQRRRFRRYGRIPVPIKNLLHEYNIKTGAPWDK